MLFMALNNLSHYIFYVLYILLWNSYSIIFFYSLIDVIIKFVWIESNSNFRFAQIFPYLLFLLRILYHFVKILMSLYFLHYLSQFYHFHLLCSCILVIVTNIKITTVKRSHYNNCYVHISDIKAKGTLYGSFYFWDEAGLKLTTQNKKST